MLRRSPEERLCSLARSPDGIETSEGSDLIMESSFSLDSSSIEREMSTFELFALVVESGLGMRRFEGDLDDC